MERIVPEAGALDRNNNACGAAMAGRGDGISRCSAAALDGTLIESVAKFDRL